jgi:two-component system, NarL family, response regulator NreC
VTVNHEIEILIADDHMVVREGLRALLQAVPGFVVVGEAGNGSEAVERTASLRPDVLLLDLQMPGLHGIDVARRVAMQCPATRILILSMHSSQTDVTRALKAGAAGYVLKDAGAEELIEGIREIDAGRTYLSSGLSRGVIGEVLDPEPEPVDERYEELTPREREVFRFAALGDTMAQIGEKLFISPRTVETHRENLMRKLGLRNQTDLVRCALRMGVLSLDARDPRFR